MISVAEAMARALSLAATPGVPLGPNPRVGCVLLSGDDPEHGDIVAEGFHRGAGTAHAEVDALARAGPAAAGTTAVVTLEPCNHTGRTGPCAQALIAAGVRRVVYAMSDPNAVASGGAATLSAAGIDVRLGPGGDDARRLNRAWLFGLEHGRPLVTWKFAATLDGRSAAADGTSRWITGPSARRDVHRRRAECDTIMVGTGTALADDPSLTVRDAEDRPLPHQPLRAVVGTTSLDPGLRVFDASAETRVFATHDLHTVLAELFAGGRRHVFLEGGPTLAAAFVRAGLVDEIVAYLAPALLGAGPASVGDLGVATIADARRFQIRECGVVGGDDDDDDGSRDICVVLAPR